MPDETSPQDDEILDLTSRLKHSGPRKPGGDDAPRPYYCTYCLDVVVVAVEEYRLCERPPCIRQAIRDRQIRIDELELEKAKVWTQLDTEERDLRQKIESLQQANASVQLVRQYESLLKSLRNHSRFHAINNRVNQILEYQRQIEELAAKIPRPAFSDEFRRRIWQRDGGICYLCLKEIQSWDGEHMELDHIRPRSKGGDDSEGNLAPAHPSCNRIKGDRDLASRAMLAILKELRKTDAERRKEFLF